MSEEMLVRFSAPTLAGIKAASLFTCRYDSWQELAGEIADMNRRLMKRGIRIIPLHREDGRCLIYVYRPKALKERLSDSSCRSFLSAEGYEGTTLGQNLCHLCKRFETCDQFPHEIGVFLDYPLEDVLGFIVHGGRDYKASGCWKVYGDAEAACRSFRRYKKCTEVYCKAAARGVSVTRLAVKK